MFVFFALVCLGAAEETIGIEVRLMFVVEVCARVRDEMAGCEVDNEEIVDVEGTDMEGVVAGGEDTGIKLAADGLRADITEVIDGVAGTTSQEGEEDTDV